MSKPAWIVTDADGQTLRVGDRVTVHDAWNPGRMGQQGEVTKLQSKPHHALFVRFCDGKEETFLAGLVRKI